MSALAQILAACGGLPSDFRGYMTPGTYTFTVPADVSSLCALTLGAGGGSSDIKAGGGYGGGGGALAYSNDISVTPGEVLTVVVGAGGVRGTWPGGASPGTATAGGDSSLSRGGTTLVLAAGGTGGSGSVGVGGLGSAALATPRYQEAMARRHPAPSCAAVVAAVRRFRVVTVSPQQRRRPIIAAVRGAEACTCSTAAAVHRLPTRTRPATTAKAWAGADQNFHGFGAGGGAFGDAGKTLVGQGADGAPGAVVLIWGGREFSTSSIF